MNQLTLRQETAAAEQQKPSRGAAVSNALARSEATYIEPVVRVPWTDEAWRATATLCGGARNSEMRSMAQALRSAGPTAADLEAYVERVNVALKASQDPRVSRMLIGMFLDAYLNVRPTNLDAYASSLLHDAMSDGHSPPVIAMACRQLRKSTRFLPSVSEFLEACVGAKAELEGKLRLAAFLRKGLAIADQMLEQGRASAEHEPR